MLLLLLARLHIGQAQHFFRCPLHAALSHGQLKMLIESRRLDPSVVGPPIVFAYIHHSCAYFCPCVLSILTACLLMCEGIRHLYHESGLSHQIRTLQAVANDLIPYV